MMKVKMKLNLLFIVMDLLTLLVYPIVLVHGKLRKFARSKESIPAENLFVIRFGCSQQMASWKL